jgi:hypothetical protein
MMFSMLILSWLPMQMEHRFQDLIRLKMGLMQLASWQTDIM